MTIPNTRVCTVAGSLSAGGICAETETAFTGDLTFDQFVEFLEPQSERPDPADPTKTLPARAGAMCQSADDRNKEQTALEQACRELGSRCSYELKKIIAIGRETSWLARHAFKRHVAAAVPLTVFPTEPGGPGGE